MNVLGMVTLQDMAAKCEFCDLCKGRIEPVFARGEPVHPVMICGMCPGPEENKAGSPFVGTAGKILNQILAESFGLTFDGKSAVYITNLVKCFVQPGTPLEQEWMSSCLPYFVVQKQLLDPKVIITLGRDVANFLLNNEEKMGDMRRNTYDYMGTKLIATYHPSYLARGGGINHKHYGRVVEDFNRAKEFV